ncbi:MAG TPA: FecR domain-containing protein [Pyrinomonadaceae bacterium]|nr:FecR domain-containing protein [Pyrinomonadaceae bacterium]
MDKPKTFLTALALIGSLLMVQSAVVLGAPIANPSKPRGELIVRGHVNVDGAQAISGVTLFSESTIATDRDAYAVINLNKSGRIELEPDSRFTLHVVEDGSISGRLESGSAHFAVPEQTATTVLTKDGEVVADVNQHDLFTVNLARNRTEVTTESGKVELRDADLTKTVAAGEVATLGPPGPVPQSGGNSFAGKTGYILLGVAAAVVITIIIIATQDDDDVVTPIPQPNPSPTT